MSAKPILIIEDHEANRDLLASLLEAGGYAVLQAGAALAGIELARQAGPCLILMDMSLPGMSGLDATRLLKADPLTATIPIMAVTAHAFSTDRSSAFEAGCCAHITKPIDTRTLISEIEKVLDGAYGKRPR